MKRALDSVNEKLLAAVSRRNVNTSSNSLPRLVAVSKLKPVSCIVEAYECGQRYFGENYIQELVEKSNAEEIIQKCSDIKFHFIGHLQSNKINKLLKVRNLYMIETIDSVKLASSINKAIEKLQTNSKQISSDDEGTTNMANIFPLGQQLKVMIQVNTSGEQQKNGVQPEEAPSLAKHIVDQCNWLDLAGIMTIGKLEGWPEGEPNRDFQNMIQLRYRIAQNLSIDPSKLELSMGMSGDFEEAIEMGSTSVRVGTMIFGQRPTKN